MESDNTWDEAENIIPEAASLFVAMRDMGYEDTAAIADLIDNSIDAQASNIWITVDADLSRLFIADDGIGMSMDTLKTAVKLGGKKQHDTNGDLGKYGLGLITASLSMGRTIRIITKHEGEYNTAELSFDRIQKVNKFIADFHTSIGTEKISFDFRTHNADSGTVLIIDDCDHIQHKSIDSFVKDLREEAGEIFRSFITDEKHICINGIDVKPKDPLYLKHDGTKVLADEDISIKKTDGSTATMHVRAAKINDFGVAKNRQLYINIYRQGFYVLRNNREIAVALEYPELYIKHNSLNLLRFELSFTSDLDDLMGVNIRKHHVVPSQEIINELRPVVNKVMKLYKEATKKPASGTPAPIPFPPIPQPSPEAPQQEQKGATNGNSQTEVGKTNPMPEYAYCSSTRAGKEDDPLFEVSISDSKVSIRYNVKNMFYMKNVIDSADSATTKRILDAMVKASLKVIAQSSSGDELVRRANSLAANIQMEE